MAAHRFGPLPRSARPRSLFLLPFLLLAPGCDTGQAGEVEVTRETLPNGATLVRYGSLPTTPAATLEPELVIGTVEGEPWEMFGEIRGVEAGPDGTVYILDHQAHEIRVFGPDGAFRETLARQGEGPAEISAANGLYLDRDGILWVNDYGKMRYLGLRPEDGSEVARVPFPVMSWGFLWEGRRDAEGRFWMSASHSRSPAQQVYPPPEGPVESSSDLYMKSIDPATEAMDSVFIGTVESRSFRVTLGEGSWGMLGIPFRAQRSVLPDPEGGFWVSEGAPYRVVRLDSDGDTALVLEAAVPRLPVTAQDLEEFLEPYVERGGAWERGFREALTHAPDEKPSISQLVLDDVGRLWVRRVRDSGELPMYDIFAREGDYLGSLELGFEISFGSPRIRHGHLYMVVPGEMEVPTVVRAPVPEL